MPKISNKTKESERLFPNLQKDEKSALFFNSVNSIILSNKFSFEEKSQVNNICQSF